MDFSWISLLLLTFSWTTAAHIYEPPSSTWILLIAVAVGLSFAGFYRQGKKQRVKSSIKSALTYCALVLAVQGAVFPFYYIWAARNHYEPVFAALSGGILNLAGVPVSIEGSLMYMGTLLKTFVFSSTWEKAGALYLLLLTVGGVVTLAMKKAGIKYCAIFFTTTFLYAVLRYVFLIILYLTYSMHSIFWERVITFVTFIPYALILTSLLSKLPLPHAEITFKGVSKQKAAITGLLAFLLIFSGVSVFGLRDPGREKQGRVLVDEYHSDWEWTTDIYDTEWFGERSGYNYYCFYNYLDKFYETARNMGPITGGILKNADVFIMKTPTKPFTEDEIAAMISFVEEGGGLYLIGDHTNVFGTGANLNQISRAFGITFNYDCTYELVGGNLSEYDAPHLMPHPAVRNMPHFLFASSNTLGAKWQAEEIIVGYGLKTLQADYSQKNFFPEDSDDPALEFGLFLQSAGVQYGRGRVLAFTDSTVFSNFWMFMPGKPELLLGSVQWLNRENTFAGASPREISAILLIIMLTINIIWWYRIRKGFPLAAFLLSGVSAVLIGTGLFHAVGALSSRPPEPIKPIVKISFEREYSRFRLPDDLEGFLSNTDLQLNTFYVWSQRLDYFPGVEETLADALRDGNLTVMAKPGKEIKNPQKILDEISAGARLLILDNAASGAFSNSLLRLAGMELVEARMGEHMDCGEIKGIPLTSNAAAVIGGEAIISDASGNTVFAVQKIGDGLIAIFSDPDLFYSFEMGDVSANLTEKTEKLANLEFETLGALLKAGENRQVIR